MSWTNLSHHIFDGINLTKIGYPPSLSVSFWDISHWQYGKVRNYCDWRTDWNVILHLSHLLVSWGSSTLAQGKYIGMVHKQAHGGVYDAAYGWIHGRVRAYLDTGQLRCDDMRIL